MSSLWNSATLFVQFTIYTTSLTDDQLSSIYGIFVNLWADFFSISSFSRRLRDWFVDVRNWGEGARFILKMKSDIDGNEVENLMTHWLQRRWESYKDVNDNDVGFLRRRWRQWGWLSQRTLTAMRLIIPKNVDGNEVDYQRRRWRQCGCECVR